MDTAQLRRLANPKEFSATQAAGFCNSTLKLQT